MKALLKITDGPDQGAEHWVEPGSVLGRRKGSILLQDPRVSSQHAEVINENGNLFLIDLKSTHGLWNPDERVNRLKLQHGATFKIGDTRLEVVRVDQTLEDRALGEMIEALKGSHDSPKEISPFPVVLILEFLQGHHTGEVWPLGYGPRAVGSQSLDLKIYDSEAREECFRLECRDRQIHLVSAHEHFVKVNNQYTQQIILQPDDLISFGDTVIKVRSQAAAT